MEGEIRALTTDLRATKDDLCEAMDEIKTWRGKDDAAFISEKSKNHRTWRRGAARRPRA
jgi:hypothetical protein